MIAHRTLHRVGLSLAVVALVTGRNATDASAQWAPDSWQTTDIGVSVPHKGKGTCASDVRCITTVTTTATDTSDTADRLAYVNGTFTGDGMFITRVDAIDQDPSARAGLMLRESANPGAKHIFAWASGDGRAGLQWRTITDSARSIVAGDTDATSVWLKLVRSGSQFTLYRSNDGVDWSEVSAQSVTLPKTLRVGLAVSGGERTRRTTAQFSLTSVSGELPLGWNAIDIGNGAGGATSYSDATFAMASSSLDISGVSDDFRFSFRTVTSDVDIVARVGPMTGKTNGTSAGLMIRRALHSAAAHVSVLVTPSGRISFARRPVAGAAALESNDRTAQTPLWLKLERRGDRITAFRSPDGAQWTPIGEDTVTLGEEIFVGLVLSGNDRNQMAGVVFEGVTVTATTENVGPTVALSSPAPGAILTAGTPFVVAANASDSDGSVARVNFFANGVLIATDLLAPYSTTWNPTAGEYVITAVATDDKGAEASSGPLSMTVQAPVVRQNAAPTVTLLAPLRGAVVAVGVPITISASAADPDGSIVGVDFLAGGVVIGSDAVAPFEISWSPAEGEYTVTAIARDDKGATAASDPADVSVRAQSTADSPWMLLFTPSSDDAMVDFYQLEVFRTSTQVASAVLVFNLGKPASVNGSISVDVTAVLADLPEAEYVAIVQAVGVSGVSSSAPSPTFMP